MAGSASIRSLPANQHSAIRLAVLILSAHLLLPPAAAGQRQRAAAALWLLLKRRRLLRPGHGTQSKAWLCTCFLLQLLCLR